LGFILKKFKGSFSHCMTAMQEGDDDEHCVGNGEEEKETFDKIEREKQR
jgi:hypothetical protein